MSCRRPLPSWSHPPQHSWSLDELKHGNIITNHSLNSVLESQNTEKTGCCITFGRIADDPSVVDIVTAHESCSRLHARIAFDQNGTPWLRDWGSGNGTFVNERRLPPEACGRGEEPKNSNRKGSRGVVLYPGDAIRFGASTRMFLLEGPEEFERDAIKLKRKMEEAAVAVSAPARSDAENQNQSREDDVSQSKTDNDDGCGWGMSDDIIATDQEQNNNAESKDHSDLAPLPSIDGFFFSAKYKISDALHKLHGQYNAKLLKLQCIQKESQRIMQKENMSVELTDGQKGQLGKNKERITTLEKEVGNLKGRIEDGMHTAIHGKERVNKRRSKEEDKHHNDDDDVDDFYDRTASSSKRQRTENDDAQSEQSLVQTWKSLLDSISKQLKVVTRAVERCTALQTQIEDSKEDDEDAFFLKNDLELANENLGKAERSMEETEKELDETEYLLKIVNPKLEWDRKEGMIGTDSEMRENVKSKASHEEVAVDAVEESDLIMMPPPPPPAITPASSSMPPPPSMAVASSSMPPPPSMAVASSSMPPPPPMDAALSSNSLLPERQRVLGPMRPPASSDGDKSSDQSSMPPPSNLGTKSSGPQKKEKKKKMGPMHPPANVQGTLAALKQAVSQPTQAHGPLPNGQTNGNNTHSQKKAPVVANPFNPQKDEWNAPVDQDGSGRTALHDKFKGRY